MAWPLASQFSAMLQNPAVAFRDPRLRACRLETNAMQQPKPWAGAFAVVYKAIPQDGSPPMAVRVFTSESPERQERYEQISDYLKTQQFGCLCNFEYHEEAVRASDGKWYPLIVMEWVEGDTIYAWAKEHCLAGNGQALLVAAQQWSMACVELARANISHGDFQQGNIMFDRSGTLKLVDYDCMCVPSLVGRRNLEVGVEPYQHPGRDENTLLSPELDSFSALMIYVALRSLGNDPSLWQRYVEQRENDKLLFLRKDFDDPANSPLYAELSQSQDAELRGLVATLFQAWNLPIDQVPRLAEMADPQLAAQARIPLTEIEQRLTARDWDGAVKLLNQRGTWRDAPEHLKPQIKHAFALVALRDQWRRFSKIPQETSEVIDRRIVATWNEKLFAGYEPAERQRMRVAEALKRVDTLERVFHLIQQSPAKSNIQNEQAIFDTAARLPQGYTYALMQRVGLARRRVSALGRLSELIKNPTTEAALIAAWKTIDEVGLGPAVDTNWKKRVRLAALRAPILKQLAELPEDMTVVERDHALVKLWDERLLEGCHEADPYRQQYETSRQRVKVVSELKAAVEERDRPAILSLLRDPLLVDYPLPRQWKPVIDDAVKKVGQGGDLLAAMTEGRKGEFYDLFDAREIKQRIEEFAPIADQLIPLTEQQILPPKRLGLRALSKDGLQLLDGKGKLQWRIRWQWPEIRFCDRCLLAVCEQAPGSKDTPRDVTVFKLLPIDRKTWTAAGDQVVLDMLPEWEQAHVAIWAVVDIGLETFTSRPVVLGRMKTKSGGGLLGGIFAGKKDGEEQPQQAAQEPKAQAPQRAEPPGMKKKGKS